MGFYTRHKRGDRFYYIDSNTGKVVINERELQRFRSLRIPPAYTNVHICKDAHNKVQAFGLDDKGRKQTVYNKVFVEAQRAKRFADLENFNDTYRKIQKDVDSILQNHKSPPKFKLIAIIVRLMMVCHLRIGSSDNVIKYKTYGLTTLENRHVQVSRDKVVIDFVGKKNVRNTSSCSDPMVVRILSKLKTMGKTSDPLFRYYEDGVFKTIPASAVNDYLKSFDPNITSKDLRTYKANILFIEHIRKIVKAMQPESATAWKKAVREAVKAVANDLHNTPAVCRKDYLHGELLEFTENDAKFRTEMNIV